MDVSDELHAKLRAIEADLDAARYRPGTWERFLHALRRRPRAERLALSIDVSHLSRKLHARGGIRTLPVTAALVLEGGGTVVAGVVLPLALQHHSNLAALATTAVWVTTFQPLIKVLTGALLGIRYDYAYLRGIEPRSKTRYGTYLAAPRWVRIAVHVSGMVGSPRAWSVASWPRHCPSPTRSPPQHAGSWRCSTRCYSCARSADAIASARCVWPSRAAAWLAQSFEKLFGMGR